MASQGLQGLVSHQVGVPSEGRSLEPVVWLGAFEATNMRISIDKIVEITIRAKPPPDLIFASLGKTAEVLSRAKSDDHHH